MLDRIRVSLFAPALVAGLLGPLVQAQPSAGLNHVPGRALVQFRAGVSEGQAANLLTAFRGRTERRIDPIHVHVVRMPNGAVEEQFLNALRNRPEVEAAEFDAIVPPSDIIPNDPLFSSQWFLTRISAPGAWQTTTGSASIIIAILDTGVDGTHPDLVSKLVAGWNIYDNNSNTADVYGHGTEVAGVTAAASNNGVGVASIAWQSWIMPVRVSNTSGSATYSSLASGLTWAADHGARVANMSYMVSDSSTVTSGAKYFQSKGGVVTSSAGNYSTVSTAADNPYILTISGTDSNDALYSWSNSGSNIDLAAPGCVTTTSRGGGYSSACGTSFSAPVVAGVAALVMAANPSLAPAQVVSVLKESADDLGAAGWDPVYGYGRVNAAGAVVRAGAATIAPLQLTFASPAPGTTLSGNTTVQIAASGGSGSITVVLSIDGMQKATLAAPYSYLWNTATVSNGTHTLSATATDSSGQIASASVSVSVSNATDLSAPTVSIVSPTDGATVRGNTVVTVSTSDDVGVTKVDLLVDGNPAGSSEAAPFNLRWNTKTVVKGTHTLQVRASDASGKSSLSPVVRVNTR